MIVTFICAIGFSYKIYGKELIFFNKLGNVSWMLLGIFCGSFVLVIQLNNFTINSKYEFKTLKILEKGETRISKKGSIVPTVCIEYLNERIELKFQKNEFERVAVSKEVIIDVKKGLLGYGVIKKFDLKEGDRKWRKK